MKMKTGMRRATTRIGVSDACWSRPACCAAAGVVERWV
jgi:hypothetical protein